MNHNPKTEHLQVYQYKPGKSGNLQGRPKSYVTILKELGYTKPVISTMVAEVMFMSYDEVMKLSESRTEPVIRKIIAHAFYNAGYNGEYKDIEPFMTILFGKPMPYIPPSPPEYKPTENSSEPN